MYIMTYPEHHDHGQQSIPRCPRSFQACPWCWSDRPHTARSQIDPGTPLEFGPAASPSRRQTIVAPLDLWGVAAKWRARDAKWRGILKGGHAEHGEWIYIWVQYESYEIIWDYHRLSLWVTHLLIGGTMHIILICTDTEWKQPWFGDVAVNFQYWDWSHLNLSWDELG